MLLLLQATLLEPLPLLPPRQLLLHLLLLLTTSPLSASQLLGGSAGVSLSRLQGLL